MSLLKWISNQYFKRYKNFEAVTNERFYICGHIKLAAEVVALMGGGLV
jgi:hypothetical protein